MKKCLAVILSVLLLLSSVPMVAASYNDDEFNWGELACSHSRLIEKAAVPSTCVVAGTAAYFVCADCHVLVGTKESLPLADHTYANACDDDCSECGFVREVGDHVYDHACDAHCNECGAMRQVGDHIYEDKVEKQPTCTEDGVMRYTCTACGESYTVGIPAVGHNYILVPGCDATCTEDGLTDGSACSACGDVLIAQEKIPANGHKYDDDYDVDCNTCGAIRDANPAPGDVDGDKNIDNYDLGLLQKYLNAWDVTIYLDAADVNNDGRVNNRDLGLLMQYINEWDVELV